MSHISYPPTNIKYTKPLGGSAEKQPVRRGRVCESVMGEWECPGLLSIVVRNTMTKSNFWKEGFISSYSL